MSDIAEHLRDRGKAVTPGASPEGRAGGGAGAGGGGAGAAHGRGSGRKRGSEGGEPGGPLREAVITPYIAVAGAAAAIAFYEEALGARLRGAPIVMPDGRIGHAELEIGEALLMLSEQHPEIGVVAPAPEGVATTLHLEVDDVDSTLARLVAAGADLTRAAADYPYGRNGVARDPFGHRWMISGPTRGIEPPAGPRHGDIGYASLWVPDVEAASAFFAAVLGWRYGPAGGPQGRHVEGQGLSLGLWGGQGRGTLFCCFAVADVEAAVQSVRQAGGRAGEPGDEPYGRVAMCTDDQGVAFGLYEPPAGFGPESGGGAGWGGAGWGEAGTGGAGGDGWGGAGRARRQGDLVQVTLEVVDSERARRFYASVLGWSFSPGRVADDWNVEGSSPAIGLRGGSEQATAVPVYCVDDIAAAVETVRAAGGSAGDPEAPYGTMSSCADSQGTRFSLVEL